MWAIVWSKIDGVHFGNDRLLDACLCRNEFVWAFVAALMLRAFRSITMNVCPTAPRVQDRMVIAISAYHLRSLSICPSSICTISWCIEVKVVPNQTLWIGWICLILARHSLDYHNIDIFRFNSKSTRDRVETNITNRLVFVLHNEATKW